MQTAENKTDSSGKKIRCEKLRNTVEKLGVHEWTNWGGTSGQTGGARVDKLGGQLDLL